MSIIIKEVEWDQTDEEITIRVSIKGKKSMDDIVLAEKFLKVNISPFYYELFFEHPICLETSTCKLLESCVKFTLKKKNNDWWSSVGNFSKENDKERKLPIEFKKEIVSEYEKCLKKEYLDKKSERSNIKRSEIDKEMKRQREIQEKIESVEKLILNEETAVVCIMSSSFADIHYSSYTFFCLG